jgi:hypothetical protein
MSNAAALVANDRFQSSVGGMGAILSGVGRLFWGNIVDKIGFQKGYTTTTALSIAMMLLLPFTTGNKLAFAAAVCSALFCLGGSIAMFVTVNAQTFGVRNAGEIYSLLFSALAFASVFGARLTMGLVDKVGWGGIFKVSRARERRKSERKRSHERVARAPSHAASFAIAQPIRRNTPSHACYTSNSPRSPHVAPATQPRPFANQPRPARTTGARGHGRCEPLPAPAAQAGDQEEGALGDALRESERGPGVMGGERNLGRL